MNTTIEKEICVYIVTHGPKCFCIPDYAQPIEVGAASRDNCVYELKDNQGLDNISLKNKQYCELTGLYWVWKNDEHDITGLYHYRRIFNLSSREILDKLKKYDVIAYERYASDSVHENFVQHIDGWYELLSDVIKKRYPDYYPTMVKYFKGNKYYACQMFVARHKWVTEYCTWLFDVLESFEKKANPEMLSDRYMAYVGEMLLSLFIYHNHNKVYSLGVSMPTNSKIRSMKFYSSHLMQKIKVFYNKLINKTIS